MPQAFYGVSTRDGDEEEKRLIFILLKSAEWNNFLNLVAVCAHNHSQNLLMMEGLESTQGRGWVTHVWAFPLVSSLGDAAFSSPPKTSDKTGNTSGFKNKNPFSSEMRVLQVDISPPCLCHKSGPRTETCRNCENHLLSQVLCFVCLFVYFVWICFQVRESSTERPEES